MRNFSRRSFAAVAIALAVVLFFAVNIVSNNWFGAARIDLTETGLYTVSEGTRTTLRNLQEPVTLRFFFSRDAAAAYPAVNAYAQRVRDLLQEYVALANGNILFEEIDPVTFTPEEDQAVAFGLTGVPTQNGDKVYFGLAGTNSTDGQETIPFFNQDRENYLEYDLTSLVYKLSRTEQPRLGVLSALPLENGEGGMMAMLQGNAQPFAIYQQLQENFDVDMLDKGVDRIPDDISTLLVAHPADFSARTRYAIDQFVLRGGNAIILVDPLSETASEASAGIGGQAAIGQSSDLPELFAAWGIQYDPEKVVADAELAQRVRFGDPSNPQTLQYLVWLRTEPPNFDSDDIVTADLQLVNFATAGALSPTEDATTSFTPLITSSPTSALLNSFVVRSTQNPADLIRNFSPMGGPFTLAARISGPASSGFTDGPPLPEGDDEAAADVPDEPLPAHIEQADNINVIVIADADLLDDKFWVNAQNIFGQRILVPTADNGAMIVNSVENMMGSNELISLRTRAPPPRNFTVVEQLRREAEAQYLAEEQRLQESISSTEQQLQQLEGQGNDNQGRAELVTPEQQAAIENFRQELLDSRAALRAVQANLRRSEEMLGVWIKLINIAAVPLIITFLAIGLWLVRRRRRLAGRGI